MTRYEWVENLFFANYQTRTDDDSKHIQRNQSHFFAEFFQFIIEIAPLLTVYSIKFCIS